MTNNNKFELLKILKKNEFKKYVIQKKHFVFGWETIDKTVTLESY